MDGKDLLSASGTLDLLIECREELTQSEETEGLVAV